MLKRDVWCRHIQKEIEGRALAARSMGASGASHLRQSGVRQIRTPTLSLGSLLKRALDAERMPRLQIVKKLKVAGGPVPEHVENSSLVGASVGVVDVVGTLGLGARPLASGTENLPLAVCNSEFELP